MTQPEVLDIGRDRPRRRVGRGAVVVLLLVVAALVGWDLDARADEDAALDRCAQQVQQEVAADRQAVGRLLGHLRPAMGSAVDEALREWLFGQARRVATSALPEVEELDARCAAIDPLPWHGAQLERRRGCLDDLDAHAAYLRSVGSGYGRGASAGEVGTAGGDGSVQP